MLTTISFMITGTGNSALDCHSSNVPETPGFVWPSSILRKHTAYLTLSRLDSQSNAVLLVNLNAMQVAHRPYEFDLDNPVQSTPRTQGADQDASPEI